MGLDWMWYHRGGSCWHCSRDRCEFKKLFIWKISDICKSRIISACVLISQLSEWPAHSWFCVFCAQPVLSKSQRCTLLPGRQSKSPTEPTCVAHFELPESKGPASLKPQWPSGDVDSFPSMEMFKNLRFLVSFVLFVLGFFLVVLFFSKIAHCFQKVKTSHSFSKFKYISCETSGISLRGLGREGACFLKRGIDLQDVCYKKLHAWVHVCMSF